jgi:hypothetical protein
MRSYNSLRLLASFFKLIGYIHCISGFVPIVFLFYKYGEDQSIMSVTISIAAIFIGFIGMVLFSALAQLISLAVNVAEDIANTAINTHTVANRT